MLLCSGKEACCVASTAIALKVVFSCHISILVHIQIVTCGGVFHGPSVESSFGTDTLVSH